MKKSALLTKTFDSDQTFFQRAKVGTAFLLLPVLFFTTMEQQDLSQISKNQYNNELAKNGFYSLFSAFRNNTLDYHAFYKTEEQSTVMKNLDTLEHFNDTHLKLVKNGDDRESKYNVMLIMVESLSASYMGVFGNDQNLSLIHI